VALDLVVVEALAQVLEVGWVDQVDQVNAHNLQSSPLGSRGMSRVQRGKCSHQCSTNRQHNQLCCQGKRRYPQHCTGMLAQVLKVGGVDQVDHQVDGVDQADGVDQVDHQAEGVDQVDHQVDGVDQADGVDQVDHDLAGVLGKAEGNLVGSNFQP